MKQRRLEREKVAEKKEEDKERGNGRLHIHEAKSRSKHTHAHTHATHTRALTPHTCQDKKVYVRTLFCAAAFVLEETASKLKRADEEKTPLGHVVGGGVKLLCVGGQHAG